MGGAKIKKNVFFSSEFLFLSFRGACKISISYDMRLLGFINVGVKKEKKKEEKKLPKIVAYGCQTTSAQRSSDQWLSISAYTDWGQLERDKREKIVDT